MYFDCFYYVTIFTASKQLYVLNMLTVIISIKHVDYFVIINTSPYTSAHKLSQHDVINIIFKPKQKCWVDVIEEWNKQNTIQLVFLFWHFTIMRLRLRENIVISQSHYNTGKSILYMKSQECLTKPYWDDIWWTDTRQTKWTVL